VNDAEAYEFYADPVNRKLTGTPRKRTGRRLTSMSSVRFTPEVIEAARDLAASKGVTVGAWIRRLVQREIDAPRHPEGLIGGSGRVGAPRILPSSLRPRTFSCPHLSVGNVVSASCGTCGPLAA
jgi:hypothetical protein